MKRIDLVFVLLLVSFLQPTAYAQKYNFALVTDVHVSPINTAPYEDLVNTVNSINETPEIKFVVVSGDLTEEGDRGSLLKVKRTLDKLKVPYYAITGNHETKWSESGMTAFGKIFGSDRFRFEYDNFMFLGFNTGPVIRMMDGHVSPQDILWLESELKQVGQNKPIIIVTHYPLLDGDVDNWYQVTDLLRKYNVKAVLGGHYHKNALKFYDGIPGFINRSNLRGNEKFGGYSIYEVNNDSILVFEKIINKEARKWGGYSLSEQYYTSDISSYKRPDFSVNEEYSSVNPVWITLNNGAIYSSPVVYNNKVYVGDDEGYMSCFSLIDGSRQWRFKTDNRILGTPAVSNNKLVFGSTDGNIYAVNATNGDLLWKKETGEAVIGGVTIDNNIAYLGGSDHRFYGLDLNNGEFKWVFSKVVGYVETCPLIYANKVYFGAWDNNMYALDKNTGELKWRWDGGLTRMHFSPAAVWPVGADGKIFFTAPDRVMTALDAETGKTVWRTSESMVRETIGLSEDKLRVYSKTMQDSVVCYSTLGNIPKRLWITNVGYGYDHAPSMPVEKNGVLFGSTKNGIIFALDALSGSLLWKHKVGNSLINTVVPLTANECLFTSAEGIVGLLRSEND